MLNDKKIGALLREKNACNRDLAEAAGVSPNMVTYYRQNKRTPTAGTLAAMANFLGCKMDDIWI